MKNVLRVLACYRIDQIINCFVSIMSLKCQILSKIITLNIKIDWKSNVWRHDLKGSKVRYDFFFRVLQPRESLLNFPAGKEQAQSLEKLSDLYKTSFLLSRGYFLELRFFRRFGTCRKVLADKSPHQSQEIRL